MLCFVGFFGGFFGSKDSLYFMLNLTKIKLSIFFMLRDFGCLGGFVLGFFFCGLGVFVFLFGLLLLLFFFSFPPQVQAVPSSFLPKQL